MIPLAVNPCWRELAVGKRKLVTQQLGLQMLMTRIRSRIKPDSPATDVTAAAGEIHGFFCKYEKLLSAEIQALSR